MDQIDKKNNSIRPVLLLVVMLIGMTLWGDETHRLAVVPKSLKSAVGCLVTVDFVQRDLEQLGLKVNSLAWVRFHAGSIPGMSPTPGELQIAVYAEDGVR